MQTKDALHVALLGLAFGNILELQMNNYFHCQSANYFPFNYLINHQSMYLFITKKVQCHI